MSNLDGEELDAALPHDLESDEPAFLAQLSTLASVALRDRFARRINALIPEEAARLWSILDLQSRIEHLLNAGFLMAAGHPEEAWALLSAAYGAVAFGRLDMGEQATKRIAEYDETELLVAVRTVIEDSHDPQLRSAVCVLVADGSIDLVEPVWRVDGLAFEWDASPQKISLAAGFPCLRGIRKFDLAYGVCSS